MRNWSALLPVVLVMASACGDAPAPAAKPASPEVPTPAAKPDAPDNAKPGGVSIDARAHFLRKKREEIVRDPAFKDVTFQSELVGPFIVFQEVNEEDVRDTIRMYDDRDGATKEVPVDGTTNPAKVEQNIRWAEKADGLAKRSAVLLAELDRRFRELFAERFKLPTLAEKGRRPTVVSLWNLPRFVKATSRPRPEDESATHLRGARDPKSHWVVTYLGDPFLMSDDEIRCADDRVQKLGDQSLLADGAEQLLREYAAIHRGRPLVDGEEDDAPASPKWFVSGFCAWLGAVEVPRDKLEAPAGADVLHERILLDCVARARADRDRAELWKLKDLMKPMHARDRATLGEKLAPGYGDTMTLYFECRAWALCHFLWNYGDGKYRRQFTDFVGLFLDGKATWQAFAFDLMKRTSISDWGEVEMEYEWYWTQLLERKVGPTKVTHTWNTPTTTAPEGTVEQDEDFLAYWKEHTGK